MTSISYLSPSHLIKGQNLTVAFSGTLTTELSSGIIHWEVKYGIIILLNKFQSVCSAELCPAGPYSASITEDVPGDSPNGRYSSKLTFLDANEAQIACASFYITL